ncbi:hypothetical protein, partial [Pseudomonas atacamensis]|uniref:hypothetical protein n=1 Tax=Pseudomonas atacamensis TaxID=2565368 RepID=UPI002B1DE56E
ARSHSWNALQNVGASLLAKTIDHTTHLLRLARVHVRKFSFNRPSMSFFNRTRLAARVFMGYHFRK